MGSVICAFVRSHARITPFLQQLEQDRFGPLPFKWIGPSRDS
jgi:hypothetical protein